jgi:hypothetical protein
MSEEALQAAAVRARKIEELHEMIATLTAELEDLERGRPRTFEMLAAPSEALRAEVQEPGTRPAPAATGQPLIVDQSNSALATTYLDTTSSGPAFYATAVNGIAILAGDDFGVSGHGYTGDGVRGTAQASSRVGVRGQSPGNGVEGRSVGPGNGVYGSSEEGNGVYGFSRERLGAAGVSIGGIGVLAFSREREAVNAASISGDGVRASTYGSFGAAVFAECASGTATGHAVVALGQSGIGIYASGEQAPIQLGRAQTAGPPVTGFHSAGEIFLDANADLYLCKVDGTPGTWTLVA